MIRRSFSGDPVEFTDDLLVIDDLGAEKGTEWVVEQLYRIVDYRYRMCLPLVVTTNLSGREIRDRFGDRILSRLVEACTAVKLTGDDKRSEALHGEKGVN
jgi:DNA replication protein DnaC